MFKEPIDHILERSGLCSLRNAGHFIKNSEVLINGIRAEGRNDRADSESDEIAVNGTVIKKQRHVYLMLNKPSGFVCSKKSDSQKTVYDLLPADLVPSKGLSLHMAGRLDADSEGLLIMTTNGTFSNWITSPDSKVLKKYSVELSSSVSKEKQVFYMENFAHGIFLEEFKHGRAFTTKPACLSFIEDKKCAVLISEGKFRQIRRMFHSLGNEVVFLQRNAIGSLVLPENLAPGNFVMLDRNELMSAF